MSRPITTLLRFTLFTLSVVLFTVGCQWVNSRVEAAPPGLELSRHQVVLSSTLPTCRGAEDYADNPPCTWNITGQQGNGEGLAFWFDGTRPHYVWATDPIKGRWRWVPGSMRRTLKQEGLTLSVSCMWRTAGDDWSVIRCANGNKHMVGW